MYNYYYNYEVNEMRKEYLECAIIINTHGIRGEVKLESLCDSPDVLADMERVFIEKGGKYIERKVNHASVFKQFVIMGIEGINDMDQAAAMKGTKLYAKRDDFELDEGTYFIADLEGLEVFDNVSGELLGKIKEVINRGAHDIYVITTPWGEKMVPVVDQFVKKIDIDRGVYIEPIPGLIKDE